jgi:hypothetical protein
MEQSFMSTAPVVSIGPANMPLASIDHNITTYRGQVFTVRKDDGMITWVDGKTYKLGYAFLDSQVGVDEADLKAAMNAKRPWLDVFYAEMTISKLAENGAVPQASVNGANGHEPSLQEQLAAALAENAALKSGGARAQNSLSIKRSEKGAVSVYGLGRWPVTQYWEQWERLLDFGDQIRAFITAHKAELSTKAPK